MSGMQMDEDFAKIMQMDSQKLIENLNEIEVQQLQLMAWDFFSAYKMGDNQRCGRIFQIICDITEVKAELPSIQDYFKGKKIGKYKGTISLKMASKYVAFISSEVRSLTDNRVKSSPIE